MPERHIDRYRQSAPAALGALGRGPTYPPTASGYLLAPCCRPDVLCNAASDSRAEVANDRAVRPLTKIDIDRDCEYEGYSG